MVLHAHTVCKTHSSVKPAMLLRKRRELRRHGLSPDDIRCRGDAMEPAAATRINGLAVRCQGASGFDTAMLSWSPSTPLPDAESAHESPRNP